MVEHSILGHFAKEQGNVRHPAAEVAGIPNTLGEGPSEELEVQQVALSDTSVMEH